MYYSIRGGTIAVLFASLPLAAAETDDEHHVLDEIVVSATPLERTVEQLAQPVSILGGDQLARQQEASIGETLANQPGVTATYFGPVASRPVIRGQYGERVRVLSNSLDSLDASALSEDHAVSIDSILADRVEVIRGPATLLYGSGAAGGLVNVVDSRVHDAPLGVPFSGAVSLGTASATGKTSGAIKFDVGNDWVSGHFDWFRRDTGDVRIPGSAESEILHEAEGHDEDEDELAEEEAFGRIENTASETEGGAAAVSFTGDHGFIGMTVSRYESGYGVPGEHHHEEEGEEEEEEHEDGVRIGLEQTRYDLTGELLHDGLFEKMKLRVAVNDYGHTEFEGDEIGTVFDTRGTDIRLELKHRSTDLLDGAFGVQYKHIDFAAIGDEAFVPSSDTIQASIFGFEEFSVSDRWTLQASARYEHQGIRTEVAPDYNGSAVGASLGALFSPADHLTFSANLAITERHPNSTELYADGPHLAVQRYEIGSVTRGDGELKTEKSTNLDLTLRGSYSRVEFGVTGFVNSIDDYILLMPTNQVIDELQVFEFHQTDADLTGFEAELLTDLVETDNGHLHARFFSDYVRGEAKDGGNLPRIPPLRFGAGLHYTTDRIDASIEATRYDEQTKTADNELPTDGYTMLDASVSYRFEAQDVLVYLRGTNLSDEEARRHSSPLKDIAPLPGRSIHVGLRWNF